MEKIRHHYRCEVAFSDTDASGWVHFPKILAYVERAEHDYLSSSGITVFERGKGGWPRVKVSCQYKRPLEFQDRIGVLLALDNIGGTSLYWKFEILKSDGEVAASGEMVSVKVDHAGAVSPISDEERKILGAGDE